MGFLKNLFKRKPGGTKLGNIIRGVASTVSGGLLGNGAMMIKPNETPAEADSRILQGLSAAAVTAQNVALQTQPITNNDGTVDARSSVEQGVIQQLVRPNLPYIIGGIIAVVSLLYLILKKK